MSKLTRLASLLDQRLDASSGAAEQKSEKVSQDGSARVDLPQPSTLKPTTLQDAGASASGGAGAHGGAFSPALSFSSSPDLLSPPFSERANEAAPHSAELQKDEVGMHHRSGHANTGPTLTHSLSISAIDPEYDKVVSAGAGGLSSATAMSIRLTQPEVDTQSDATQALTQSEAQKSTLDAAFLPPSAGLTLTVESELLARERERSDSRKGLPTSPGSLGVPVTPTPSPSPLPSIPSRPLTPRENDDRSDSTAHFDQTSHASRVQSPSHLEEEHSAASSQQLSDYSTSGTLQMPKPSAPALSVLQSDLSYPLEEEKLSPTMAMASPAMITRQDSGDSMGASTIDRASVNETPLQTTVGDKATTPQNSQQLSRVAATTASAASIPTSQRTLRPLSEWKNLPTEEVIRDGLLTLRFVQTINFFRLRLPAALAEPNERASLQIAWEFWRERAGRKMYYMLLNHDTEHLRLADMLLKLWGESLVDFYRHIAMNTTRPGLRIKLLKHLSHMRVRFDFEHSGDAYSLNANNIAMARVDTRTNTLSPDHGLPKPKSGYKWTRRPFPRYILPAGSEIQNELEMALRIERELGQSTIVYQDQQFFRNSGPASDYQEDEGPDSETYVSDEEVEGTELREDGEDTDQANSDEGRSEGSLVDPARDDMQLKDYNPASDVGRTKTISSVHRDESSVSSFVHLPYVQVREDGYPAVSDQELLLASYMTLLERLYPNTSYHTAYQRSMTQQLAQQYPNLSEDKLVLANRTLALPELAPPAAVVAELTGAAQSATLLATGADQPQINAASGDASGAGSRFVAAASAASKAVSGFAARSLDAVLGSMSDRFEFDEVSPDAAMAAAYGLDPSEIQHSSSGGELANPIADALDRVEAQRPGTTLRSRVAAAGGDVAKLKPARASGGSQTNKSGVMGGTGNYGSKARSRKHVFHLLYGDEAPKASLYDSWSKKFRYLGSRGIATSDMWIHRENKSHNTSTGDKQFRNFIRRVLTLRADALTRAYNSYVTKKPGREPPIVPQADDAHVGYDLDLTADSSAPALDASNVLPSPEDSELGADSARSSSGDSGAGNLVLRPLALDSSGRLQDLESVLQTDARFFSDTLSIAYDFAKRSSSTRNPAFYPSRGYVSRRTDAFQRKYTRPKVAIEWMPVPLEAAAGAASGKGAPGKSSSKQQGQVPQLIPPVATGSASNGQTSGTQMVQNQEGGDATSLVVVPLGTTTELAPMVSATELLDSTKQSSLPPQVLVSGPTSMSVDGPGGLPLTSAANPGLPPPTDASGVTSSGLSQIVLKMASGLPPNQAALLLRERCRALHIALLHMRKWGLKSIGGISYSGIETLLKLLHSHLVSLTSQAGHGPSSSSAMDAYRSAIALSQSAAAAAEMMDAETASANAARVAARQAAAARRRRRLLRSQMKAKARAQAREQLRIAEENALAAASVAASASLILGEQIISGEVDPAVASANELAERASQKLIEAQARVRELEASDSDDPSALEAAEEEERAAAAAAAASAAVAAAEAVGVAKAKGGAGLGGALARVGRGLYGGDLLTVGRSAYRVKKMQRAVTVLDVDSDDDDSGSSEGEDLIAAIRERQAVSADTLVALNSAAAVSTYVAKSSTSNFSVSTQSLSGAQLTSCLTLLTGPQHSRLPAPGTSIALPYVPTSYGLGGSIFGETPGSSNPITPIAALGLSSELATTYPVYSGMLGKPGFSDLVYRFYSGGTRFGSMHQQQLVMAPHAVVPLATVAAHNGPLMGTAGSSDPEHETPDRGSKLGPVRGVNELLQVLYESPQSYYMATSPTMYGGVTTTSFGLPLDSDPVLSAANTLATAIAQSAMAGEQPGLLAQEADEDEDLTTAASVAARAAHRLITGAAAAVTSKGSGFGSLTSYDLATQSNSQDSGPSSQLSDHPNLLKASPLVSTIFRLRGSGAGSAAQIQPQLITNAALMRLARPYGDYDDETDGEFQIASEDDPLTLVEEEYFESHSGYVPPWEIPPQAIYLQPHMLQQLEEELMLPQNVNRPLRASGNRVVQFLDDLNLAFRRPWRKSFASRFGFLSARAADAARLKWLSCCGDLDDTGESSRVPILTLTRDIPSLERHAFDAAPLLRYILQTREQTSDGGSNLGLLEFQGFTDSKVEEVASDELLDKELPVTGMPLDFAVGQAPATPEVSNMFPSFATEVSRRMSSYTDTCVGCTQKSNLQNDAQEFIRDLRLYEHGLTEGYMAESMASVASWSLETRFRVLLERGFNQLEDLAMAYYDPHPAFFTTHPTAPLVTQIKTSAPPTIYSIPNASTAHIFPPLLNAHTSFVPQRPPPLTFHQRVTREQAEQLPGHLFLALLLQNPSAYLFKEGLDLAIPYIPDESYEETVVRFRSRVAAIRAKSAQQSGGALKSSELSGEELRALAALEEDADIALTRDETRCYPLCPAAESLGSLFFRLTLEERRALVASAVRLVFAFARNDRLSVREWANSLPLKPAFVSSTGHLCVVPPRAAPQLYAVYACVALAAPCGTQSILAELANALARKMIFLPSDLPDFQAPLLYAAALRSEETQRRALMAAAGTAYAAAQRARMAAAKSSRKGQTLALDLNFQFQTSTILPPPLGSPALPALPHLDFSRLLVRLAAAGHFVVSASEKEASMGIPVAQTHVNSRKEKPLMLRKLVQTKPVGNQEEDDPETEEYIDSLGYVQPLGKSKRLASSKLAAAREDARRIAEVVALELSSGMPLIFGESCVDPRLFVPKRSLSLFHIFILRILAARLTLDSVVASYVQHYELTDFNELSASAPLGPLPHVDVASLLRPNIADPLGIKASDRDLPLQIDADDSYRISAQGDVDVEYSPDDLHKLTKSAQEAAEAAAVAADAAASAAAVAAAATSNSALANLGFVIPPSSQQWSSSWVSVLLYLREGRFYEAALANIAILYDDMQCSDAESKGNSLGQSSDGGRTSSDADYSDSTCAPAVQDPILSLRKRITHLRDRLGNLKQNGLIAQEDYDTQRKWYLRELNRAENQLALYSQATKALKSHREYIPHATHPVYRDYALEMAHSAVHHEVKAVLRTAQQDGPKLDANEMSSQEIRRYAEEKVDMTRAVLNAIGVGRQLQTVKSLEALLKARSALRRLSLECSHRDPQGGVSITLSGEEETVSPYENLGANFSKPPPLSGDPFAATFVTPAVAFGTSATLAAVLDNRLRLASLASLCYATVPAAALLSPMVHLVEGYAPLSSYVVGSNSDITQSDPALLAKPDDPYLLIPPIPGSVLAGSDRFRWSGKWSDQPTYLGYWVPDGPTLPQLRSKIFSLRDELSLDETMPTLAKALFYTPRNSQSKSSDKRPLSMLEARLMVEPIEHASGTLFSFRGDAHVFQLLELLDGLKLRVFKPTFTWNIAPKTEQGDQALFYACDKAASDVEDARASQVHTDSPVKTILSDLPLMQLAERYALPYIGGIFSGPCPKTSLDPALPTFSGMSLTQSPAAQFPVGTLLLQNRPTAAFHYALVGRRGIALSSIQSPGSQLLQSHLPGWVQALKSLHSKAARVGRKTSQTSTTGGAQSALPSKTQSAVDIAASAAIASLKSAREAAFAQLRGTTTDDTQKPAPLRIRRKAAGAEDSHESDKVGTDGADQIDELELTRFIRVLSWESNPLSAIRSVLLSRWNARRLQLLPKDPTGSLTPVPALVKLALEPNVTVHGIFATALASALDDPANLARIRMTIEFLAIFCIPIEVFVATVVLAQRVYLAAYSWLCEVEQCDRDEERLRSKARALAKAAFGPLIPFLSPWHALPPGWNKRLALTSGPAGASENASFMNFCAFNAPSPPRTSVRRAEVAIEYATKWFERYLTRLVIRRDAGMDDSIASVLPAHMQLAPELNVLRVAFHIDPYNLLKNSDCVKPEFFNLSKGLSPWSTPVAFQLFIRSSASYLVEHHMWLDAHARANTPTEKSASGVTADAAKLTSINSRGFRLAQQALHMHILSWNALGNLGASIVPTKQLLDANTIAELRSVGSPCVTAPDLDQLNEVIDQAEMPTTQSTTSSIGPSGPLVDPTSNSLALCAIAARDPLLLHPLTIAPSELTSFVNKLGSQAMSSDTDLANAHQAVLSTPLKEHSGRSWYSASQWITMHIANRGDAKYGAAAVRASQAVQQINHSAALSRASSETHDAHLSGALGLAESFQLPERGATSREEIESLANQLGVDLKGEDLKPVSELEESSVSLEWLHEGTTVRPSAETLAWIQHTQRQRNNGILVVLQPSSAMEELVFFLRYHPKVLADALTLFMPNSPLLHFAKFVCALRERASTERHVRASYDARQTAGLSCAACSCACTATSECCLFSDEADEAAALNHLQLFVQSVTSVMQQEQQDDNARISAELASGSSKPKKSKKRQESAPQLPTSSSEQTIAHSGVSPSVEKSPDQYFAEDATLGMFIESSIFCIDVAMAYLQNVLYEQEVAHAKLRAQLHSRASEQAHQASGSPIKLLSAVTGCALLARSHATSCPRMKSTNADEPTLIADIEEAAFEFVTNYMMAGCQLSPTPIAALPLLRVLASSGFLGLRKAERRYVATLSILPYSAIDNAGGQAASADVKARKQARKDAWERFGAAVTSTAKSVLLDPFPIFSMTTTLQGRRFDAATVTRSINCSQAVTGAASDLDLAHLLRQLPESCRHTETGLTFVDPLLADPMVKLATTPQTGSQMSLASQASLLGVGASGQPPLGLVDGDSIQTALSAARDLILEHQQSPLWEYPTERIRLWHEVAAIFEQHKLPARQRKSFYLGLLSTVVPPEVTPPEEHELHLRRTRPDLVPLSVSVYDSSLPPGEERRYIRSVYSAAAGVTHFRLSIDEHALILSFIAQCNEEMGIASPLSTEFKAEDYYPRNARMREIEREVAKNLTPLEQVVARLAGDPSLSDLLVLNVDINNALEADLAPQRLY